MMKKTDYELVGSALASLPIGARVTAYKRLVRTLAPRNPDFDPYKFGGSMNLPPLMRMKRKETRNASS